MSELWSVFTTTFGGIVQVFLVAALGGALVRTKVVSQGQIQGVSGVTTNVFLPCLIFSNITLHFDTQRLDIWWVLPLSAVAMVAVGLLAGWALFLRELPQKRNMLAVAGMQNAGYLALPIGKALFPERFDTEFSVYCFLFILGLSPLLWSVGKHLTTSSHDERLSVKGLVTPPLIANVLALVFVFTGLRGIVPGPLAKSIHLLGEAAVPAATFVLGASLGGLTLRVRPYLFDAARALGVKLFLIPLATLLVLRRFPGLDQAYPNLGAFFIIQSASAPATALILQVRNYGGDEAKVGSVLFLGYALCALTLPFWYAVWRVMG